MLPFCALRLPNATRVRFYFQSPLGLLPNKHFLQAAWMRSFCSAASANVALSKCGDLFTPSASRTIITSIRRSCGLTQSADVTLCFHKPQPNGTDSQVDSLSTYGNHIKLNNQIFLPSAVAYSFKTELKQWVNWHRNCFQNWFIILWSREGTVLACLCHIW